MKFAAVITLALLVVSCHHEKAASAETATAPDPCALISTDDLRRITGFHEHSEHFDHDHGEP